MSEHLTGVKVYFVMERSFCSTNEFIKFFNTFCGLVLLLYIVTFRFRMFIGQSSVVRKNEFMNVHTLTHSVTNYTSKQARLAMPTPI